VSTGDLESSAAQISADGRYVAFVGKLLPVGVTVALTQALLLDRATGTTMLMSRTPAGAPGAGLNTSGLSISADGARVAFASDAADLVPGDTNGATDVFVYERATQTVRRLSVDAQGVQGNFGSLWPSISADGRFVAFMSVATNLVPGDTNAKQDFFRTELATGAIERLSVTSAGEQVFGQCGNVRLSGDGRLAFFSSDAPTLVPNDGNESYDVFLRDTEQHTTTRLAVGAGGAEPNGGSNVFSVSPDGRFIGLTSTATNLVPGDVNGVSDVFVVDRGPQCHASSFCTPATGGTAAIGMQGSTSLSANDLVLTCSGLPADTFGRFCLGTQPIDPGVPFGNGMRCIGGTIARLGLVQAVGTSATLAFDSTSSAFGAIRAGETRYFQLVYRDPAPGGSGFGTSDGLLVTFCP
jgi:hypothetical protein